MTTKSFLFLCSSLISFVSCGGSSDSSSDSFAGTWKGEALNGGANCSDGFFIGAGSGTVAREVELLVSGGEEDGQKVTIIDGECQAEGTRDGDSVRALPTSGCHSWNVYYSFKLVDDGTASFYISSDPNIASEENNNAPTCVVQYYGTVER